VKKLDALTGIRFVAAALVVVHHLAGFGGFNSSLESGVSLGDGAVSMFFELSGFVLFYAYDGIIDVRRYAVARFARIYPLHITCIGLILIFVNPYSGLANRLILLDNALLLQSYVPVSNLFFSVNSPSWSISTEAFFYLCFPFLLANFRGSWAWKLLLTLAPALSMILIVNLTELPDYHGMNWAPVSLGLLYINPLARLF
jgi:peptidoglycan/LPS O-acetylase OafA/YrhL